MANKTVKNTGDVKIGPEGFEFVLENAENGDKTILTSNTDGEAIFTLPFTAADIGKTFAYILTETDKGAVGMTYDPRIYNITVSVALREDNKLMATVIMNGDTVVNPVAEFVNIYDREKPEDPETGDDSRLAFWFGMMIVSGTACIFLSIMERRYRTQKLQ